MRQKSLWLRVKPSSWVTQGPPLQHLRAAAQTALLLKRPTGNLKRPRRGRAQAVWELPAGTFRLMSGKPCPGAGGLAGLEPLVAFFVAGDAVGDAFRLKGFSLQED